MPEVQTIAVSTDQYHFELDADAGRVRVALPGGDSILELHDAMVLRPRFAGGDSTLSNVTITELSRRGGEPQRVRIRAELTGAVAGWVVNDLYFLPERIVCSPSYRGDRDHAVTEWTVGYDGGQLEAETVHAYVRPEVNSALGGTEYPAASLDINTVSHNWLPSPMVPRVLLKRGAFSVAVGGTRVAHDFGLYLRAEAGSLERLAFDYGGTEHPRKMSAGQVDHGPRLQIQVTRNLTNDEAHAAFTRAMVDDGIVRPRRYRPEDAAWFRPWYCTWGDQTTMSKTLFAQDQSQANKSGYERIKEVLTADRVLEAAKLIREREMNVGTIIIDDGWQDTRGDWNLIERKFPDMRGLIDELHAMDFRVVLWWAPFAIEDHAEILKRDDIVSGVNVHGETVIDYSMPAARQWVCEKLHTWFGDGPDGWNVDGLKLDFFVEKVVPATVRGDDDWRGEERYFRNFIRMLHGIMSLYNDSPGITSAPLNPHVAEYLVTVLTEERFDRSLWQLPMSQPMRRAMIGDVVPTAHFNYHVETAREYVEMSRAIGGIPQIGVLLAEKMTGEILDELTELLDEG